ncbi:MAG: hypothetical protein H7Y38_12705, partial [Armatimonadetes bacterium]|nr:hypothetical protein [Armatimonadota bacterium]
ASLPMTLLLACLATTPAFAQEPPVPVPPVPETAPAAEPAQEPVNPRFANPGDAIPKGRIRVFVRDAVTREYLNGAAVFLDDPTKTDLRSIPYYVGDSSRLDENRNPLGGVGFVVSDPIPAHEWYVVALQEGYETGRASVTVLADGTVDVTIYLRIRERVEPFILLSTRDTSNSTTRTLPFVRTIPVETNRQSVNNVIASAPGFVQNSLGQVHPRGQRFGVATYLDGFLLPSNPTGSLFGNLPQDVIQEYIIRNGGLSAQYGADLGVAVDLSTRSATALPFIDAMVTSGGLGTDEVYVTIGQRFPLRGGLAREAAQAQERENIALYGGNTILGASRPAGGLYPYTGPTFGYLLHVNQRNTNVVTESPQENMGNNNTGHNNGIFFKAELIPSEKTKIIGLINYNAGQAGIANRERAGGVGFAGRTDGSGTGAQQLATSLSTPSQSELGQSQFQKESNALGMLQVSQVLRPRDSITNPDSTLTLSFGGSENDYRVQNRNRNFDPRDLTDPSSPLYRENSSLEFNPTTRKYYDQFQSQIDLVLARGAHIVKSGVVINDYRSEERYRFEPGSQLALNALFAKSALLVPFSVVPDQSGRRDFNGNQYVSYQSVQAQTPGVTIDRTANAPSGRIRREGEYAGYYVQDTWAFNPTFTINSGLRLDTFAQSAIGGSNRNGAGIQGNQKTDVSELSPRLNFAYELPYKGVLGFLGGRGTRRAVLRAGYNGLFQRPPLGQGTYFGVAPIRPQTADSYEVGLEKQLGSRQTLKATLYSTQFQNYLDVEGLFPGTQFSTGALALVNYPRAQSEGFEVTYNYNPTYRFSDPLTFFATYTNSNTKILARGRSFDSLGRLVTKERPDIDQLHTLNFGFTYRLPGNSAIGMSSYLGSGLFGSLRPGSDDRDSIAEVNLRLSTSPRLFQKSFGLDVTVENLFDQQNRYNFYTGYEAIRIQTGRRILTSVYARF